jgi:hypothetical protein
MLHLCVDLYPTLILRVTKARPPVQELMHAATEARFNEQEALLLAKLAEMQTKVAK